MYTRKSKLGVITHLRTQDRMTSRSRETLGVLDVFVNMSHQTATGHHYHHLNLFDKPTARSILSTVSSVRQMDGSLGITADGYQDTTTLMVETIWPLSTYIHSRHVVDSTRQPSKMELRYFIQEVLKRSKASYSTLQVALYYLVLIRPHVPKHDFTHEQPENSAAYFSLQCGRRMFIAALILASKYLQDRNFSASGWSKISGLSTWDLNVNEMAFLKAIDWKLHVPDILFNRWTDIVLKYSPSSHQGPRSSPRPILSWKEVVLRLTPQLDTIDFDSELSDDSGYCSPGSDSTGDMSPPPLPLHDTIVPRSNASTPTPTNTRLIGQWLERTPSASRALPQQPHLAPLPTPTLTPQSNPFCTPAVSALGCHPSMRSTMSQINSSTHDRCILDRVSDWRPRLPESFARNVVSSPDSDASSQYSDASSSRPSRSSSISSVASSSCAPVQPTPLAVQATRRCANMAMNGGAPRTLSPPRMEEDSAMLTPKSSTRKRSHDLLREISRSQTETEKEDQLAATVLRDLALGVTIQSHPKRMRPNQSLGVQDAVRRLNAPELTRLQSSTPTPTPTVTSKPLAARPKASGRCLADITNTNVLPATKTFPPPATVVEDEDVASTWMLRKENQHAVREANKRPTKSVGRTRKSGCAGSERGGRGEVRRGDMFA